jgi:hypothetical protein
MKKINTILVGVINKIWIGSTIIIAIVSLFFIQSCKKNTSSSPFSIPSITTELLDFTETTATVAGDITSNGGTTITKSGVCWGINDNPTINDNKTTDGILDIGQFISEIKPLTSNTKYYVRAYATNDEGTGYGKTVSFTTKDILKLTITTVDISEITATSAVSGGNITNDGGSPITARGVCWSIDPNPTISSTKTTDGSGTGSFTSNLTGLTSGLKYYVRAYATNAAGTAYGLSFYFNTLTAAGYPILTTTAISAISATSSASGGNITSDGGAAITARGVCWSTSSNPTISNNKTTDGNGTGSFTSNLTGLTSATKYYVRAFATNSAGTAYGNEVNFTTNNAQTNVQIGDAFQGGKVFYILQSTDVGYDPNVQHGLICALADQSTTTGIRWNNGTNVTTNATAEAIGTGSANTALIIGVQGSSNTHAAGLAKSYNVGTYTDWFLPSYDELVKLYINRSATGTSFAAADYWSSSEFSNTDASYLDFNDGSGYTWSKTSLYRVRAIRKF